MTETLDAIDRLKQQMQLSVLGQEHVVDSLKPGGRCGMVVDEGLLFRTNERGLVQVKRKLLDDCDLWCVLSLPAGVFTQAGASVKTNLLFFTRGSPTESVWYYDLSDIKINPEVADEDVEVDTKDYKKVSK